MVRTWLKTFTVNDSNDSEEEDYRVQSETLASPEDDYFSNLMSRISLFLRKSDVAIILPKSDNNKER